MNYSTKNFVFYGLAIAIFAVIIAWSIVSKSDSTADKNTSQNSPMGILTAQETNFNFGTISMKNGKVSHKFELKNESSEPVTIEKAQTSCMCTTAVVTSSSGQELGSFGMPGHGSGSSKTNIKVDPNDTIIVEAVFDPATHGPSGTGLAERTVYIETNSQKTAKIELNFKAVVTQ